MTRLIHIVTVRELQDDGTWKTIEDHSYQAQHIPIRCDRGAVQQAKTQGQQAGSVAGQAGVTANQIGSTLIPGLEAEATHPTGLTAEEKANALTKSQEALGGEGASITGAAKLQAMRTRNAGGFAPALDEAARIRGRQAATNAQNISLEDARVAREKQMAAQQMLQGLYGTTSGNQLRAMGLQSQDLQNQLAAGRQGWLQNLEGGLETVADVAKAFRGGK